MSVLTIMRRPSKKRSSNLSISILQKPSKYSHNIYSAFSNNKKRLFDKVNKLSI